MANWTLAINLAYFILATSHCIASFAIRINFFFVATAIQINWISLETFHADASRTVIVCSAEGVGSTLKSCTSFDTLPVTSSILETDFGIFAIGVSQTLSIENTANGKVIGISC